MNIGMEMLSAFTDSSIDNVLLQTNPDFTSHFLNSSWFPLFCRIHFPWLFPDFPGENKSFFLTNLFTQNTNVGFQSLAITLETKAVEQI